MNGELKVEGLKRWDDVVLNRDGTARPITKVRVWLGPHGPFEQTFDRGTSVQVIEQWIRDTRAELERLHTL